MNSLVDDLAVFDGEQLRHPVAERPLNVVNGCSHLVLEKVVA